MRGALQALLIGTVLGVASPALAIETPTEQAIELIGPRYEGTAYLCPGAMTLNRVVEAGQSASDPKEVALRFKAALKANKCRRADDRFDVVRAYAVTELNQGEGRELWLELVLKDSKGQTVYGLVGVITD